MRDRRLTLLLTIPLLVALAACSGDDGLSSEEQEFADKWAETLRDDDDGFGVAADEADCMGEAIMAELGTDPFENAEVTPGDISADEDSNSPGELVGDEVITDEQANAILDVWEEDCVDLPAILARSGSTDFELDGDGEQCFEDGLAEGTLARDLIRPSFTSGQDTPEADTMTDLLGLLEDCGSSTASSFVGSIAAELSADGTLTTEQGECVAQALVDDLGLERIVEVSGGGDFENADPADQQEFASALLAAAGACDVPLSALGG
jgi:hypothetical protein